MKPTRKQTPSETVPIQNQRRRFIRERIEWTGQVTYQEVARAFRKTTRGSFIEDVKTLKQLGDAIDFQETKNGRVVIHTGRPIVTTKKYRENQASEQKKEIAEVAAGLIWGLDAALPSDADVNNTAHRHTSERQLDDLSTSSFKLVAQRASRLRSLLSTYWNKSHRAVGIDSGTTTEWVTRVLTKLRIADRKGKISSLSVFTNSPSILDHFREHALQVGQGAAKRPTGNLEAIVVGGRLRLDTDAITGELARKCLESWQLHLDIAVIGSTNINFEDSLLRCDSEDEALTKTLFLSRSTIRCIVADSSKFRTGAIFSSFPFTAINDRNIDIIVTDCDASRDHLKQFSERGVVLINPTGSFQGSK